MSHSGAEMPTPVAYLAALHDRGVRLWAEGGQLRYHAKKGALSAEELIQLRRMKEELLAELGRAHAAGGPLTIQQRWLLGLMEQHADWPRTLGFALRLTGSLQLTALEKSLARTIRAHGALRTRIVTQLEAPCQQVDALADLPLQIVSVEGKSDDERMNDTLQHIGAITRRPMDHSVGPAMRASLLQLSDSDHVLVLVLHRLVVDCLAMSRVLRDLWNAYAEHSGRRTAPAPEEECQLRYRDHALWQQTQPQDAHSAYWKERLEGAPCIRWPADADAGERAAADRRECGPSGAVRSQQIGFGELLSGQLRALGKQTQSLTSLLLLTVYARFVSRWCRQRDFVLPFLIAGRSAEHDSTVGLFSHVLYLRITLTGDETFATLLKQVSNEFYRAMFRQDSGRTTIRRPELLAGTLCQWLSWHPAEVPGLDTPQPQELGFTVKGLRFQSPEALTNVPPAATALEICFFEEADNICTLALYRSDRFTERAMAQLLRELHSTAQQVV